MPGFQIVVWNQCSLSFRSSPNAHATTGSRHRHCHVTLTVTFARLLILRSFSLIFDEKRDCSQSILNVFILRLQLSVESTFFCVAVSLISNSINFPNQWEPESWPVITGWTHAFPALGVGSRVSLLPVSSPSPARDGKKRDPGNEAGESLRGI